MSIFRIHRRRGLPVTSWQSLHPRLGQRLPQQVRPWIRLQTSMTKRLNERFGGHVAVRVLENGMGRLHDDEQHLFFPRQNLGHVREVVLHANDQHLMLARTVFTSRNLRRDPQVTHLGSRPLGELLFANGPAEWLLREYIRLGPAAPVHRLVRRVVGPRKSNVWARRSLFLLNRHPLLVTEIFLPAMLGEGTTASPNS